MPQKRDMIIGDCPHLFPFRDLLAITKSGCLPAKGANRRRPTLTTAARSRKLSASALPPSAQTKNCSMTPQNWSL